MLQVLVAISQSFVAEKRHGAMQKLLVKKRRRIKKERVKKKMDTKVSKIFKTMGT
jgi:hypothetical protein